MKGFTVYSCDYCGKDFTDAKFCCQAQRDYLNAHGHYERPMVQNDLHLASREQLEQWYTFQMTCLATMIHLNGGEFIIKTGDTDSMPTSKIGVEFLPDDSVKLTLIKV